MSNKSLNAAKAAKNDEFYTCREDIEKELSHYVNHFRDKVVYCNCDDPARSEFWRYFRDNFRALGLKKLIATHYVRGAASSATIMEMRDGGPVITIRDLGCDGDFRSEPCVEFLKEADIVVTNPPFSLFREFMALLTKYEKRFLIVGNMNAVAWKEIFPLIKEGRVWLGCERFTTFTLPDGTTTKSIGGLCRWYTNLEHQKHHEPLDLRGNFYDPEKYPKYDNYDAIEVSRVKNIPCNYDGMMGVPLTFIDVYNPEQFEIIGLGDGELARSIGVTPSYRGRSELAYHTEEKNFCPFKRMVVKLRTPGK